MPNDFNFSNTGHTSVLVMPPKNNGEFAFVNKVPEFGNVFYTGSPDHTNDSNGYMYLINIGVKNSELFNMSIGGLCTGTCYEFSAYLANVVKLFDSPKPNIRFEVRPTDDTSVVAQYNTGEISQFGDLTWCKYAVSFRAPNQSVKLLLITNVGGENGNDVAIDDIELRVCSNKTTASCFQRKYI